MSCLINFPCFFLINKVFFLLHMNSLFRYHTLSIFLRFIWFSNLSKYNLQRLLRCFWVNWKEKSRNANGRVWIWDSSNSWKVNQFWRESRLPSFDRENIQYERERERERERESYNWSVYLLKWVFRFITYM